MRVSDQMRVRLAFRGLTRPRDRMGEIQEQVTSGRTPSPLHRHLPVVLQILGEVDRGHSAAANLPLDGVAVGQGLFQSVKGVGHGAASPAGSTTKMRRAGSGGQLAQAAGFDGMCCASPRIHRRRFSLEAEI